MSRPVVRVADFLPEAEARDDMAPDELRDHAYGKLLHHLRHVVWAVCMDTGPAVTQSIECIQRILQPAWLADHERAVSELAALVDAGHTAPVAGIIERNATLPFPLSAEELKAVADARGVWSHYGAAMEVYGKYGVALAKIETRSRRRAAAV